MGTGWRRAFCTTVQTPSSSDSPVVVLGEPHRHPPTPKTPSSLKLGFFFNNKSNPSTPRSKSNNNISANAKLDEEDNNHNLNNFTPRLTVRCKTTTNKKNPSDPKKSISSSNPSTPRSPFSILKTFAFSRTNSCGVCSQTLKSSTTAVFTAECSHAFHFPCISKHVIRLQNSLICPICKTTWKDNAHSFLNLQSSCNHTPPDGPPADDRTPRPTHDPTDFVSYRSKGYADDEPLRRQAALPPPLEDEEQLDDDNHEFRGFFVNPVPSDDEFRRQQRDYYYCKQQVEVMLMPEVAIISSTQSHHTYAVVLKVKAPPPPPLGMLSNSRRAPIDLVAVLDVSASMAGAKLQMLKRAMNLVISSLGSSDRLSIVAFAASPKRLLALRKMSPGGQRSARRVIDHLACGNRGISCVAEALKKATDVLQDRRERNPVASIILLSDGHEEHVTTDNTTTATTTNQRQTSSQTRFAHVEIPVRTLEKTGEPAEDAFTKCVGGLLSVVAQDLRIELGVAVGSDPTEITAVYSCNGNPMVLNSGSIRFGDLYAEEEREVLVEVRVPRWSKSNDHHVLSGRCCYKDPATQEVVYGGEKALVVGRAQKVERLRCLFIATRAVAESRLLVEHNKLRTAHHLLSSARDLLMQSGETGFIKGLEAELVDLEGVIMSLRL